MLTNSLKISDTTKTEFLELISVPSDQKIRQKYRRADWRSVSDPLTSSLSRSVLTRGFCGIQVIPLFAVYTFRKKKSSKAHLFFVKVFKFCVNSENAEKNLKNIFSFGDNSIWIGSVKQSPLLRQNTCHRVSLC